MSSSAANDVKARSGPAYASSGQCSRPRRAARQLTPWRTTRLVSGRRTPASWIASARRGSPGLLLPCSAAARDVSAAPLAPGHPREGGRALDRSTAADALPLEAALLHVDSDFELHRLSHGPGDAAVSRATTRRVVVVQTGSGGLHDRIARGAEVSRRCTLTDPRVTVSGGAALAV